MKFEVGDTVLLKAHPISKLKKNFSAKLAPKWRGPYTLQERLSPVNFGIQGEGREVRIAHVDQIKLII